MGGPCCSRRTSSLNLRSATTPPVIALAVRGERNLFGRRVDRHDRARHWGSDFRQKAPTDGTPNPLPVGELGWHTSCLSARYLAAPSSSTARQRLQASSGAPVTVGDERDAVIEAYPVYHARLIVDAPEVSVRSDLHDLDPHTLVTCHVVAVVAVAGHGRRTWWRRREPHRPRDPKWYKPGTAPISIPGCRTTKGLIMCIVIAGVGILMLTVRSNNDARQKIERLKQRVKRRYR